MWGGGGGELGRERGRGGEGRGGGVGWGGGGGGGGGGGWFFISHSICVGSQVSRIFSHVHARYGARIARGKIQVACETWGGGGKHKLFYQQPQYMCIHVCLSTCTTCMSSSPGALPFSLLNLSDIILARDSRRSTLTQHGTGTSSSQSGDAYYTSNPSVLNVPLLSVSRSFRNENHFPVQITMKVTSNKRRECSGGTTDSKPVTETSSEVATRPALKIHVSDKPIVVEGGKEAIEEGTREEEEEGERRASSPEYSMGSDCSLSSTSSLSEKPGSPASASRPPVTATTQPSTHSGRPRDGEENATLDDAKGTTTSDTQQGAALLSGSGGGGGGGDSSARPGGLKLAQYTLENLPENQSSTSSYMSDLLNAMCGGSGLGGVLGLLGTQTAVPSASGARGEGNCCPSFSLALRACNLGCTCTWIVIFNLGCALF